MGIFTKIAQQIFASVDETGSPRKISEQEVGVWGTELERVVGLFVSSGGLIYSSLASLNADLNKPANAMAWVIGDPVAANNGVYGKAGASGAGSWTRRADLPFSFIVASDAGAGTPNAIQATTSISVSGSALIWMNIADTNTGSPVTVSFNGGSPLTVKTNSGGDVAAGGLISGMVLMGVISGSTFRILNDQVSGAIVAAAEAAQAAAEAAAASAVDLVGRAATALQPATTTFAQAKRYTSGISISEFPDINFDGNTAFDSAPGFSEMCSKVALNGGGTIDIFPGADICFAQPAFVYPGVYLRGGGGRMLNLDNGAFGTRIRPSANMQSLITQENIANLIHSVGIEGINFDGRKDAGITVSHLIHLSPVNCHFERNTLQKASGDGIYLPTNSVAAWVNWIAYNHIAYNGAWGARLEITDSDFCNNYVSFNGDRATNVGGGIWEHAYGNVRIVANQVELSHIGILLESVDSGFTAIEGQSVIGNFLDHVNVGIHLKKGALGASVRSTSSFVANKFNVCSVAGLRIDNHIFGGTIVGNSFTGQFNESGAYNVDFVSGADNHGWSIIGNAFSNPSPTGYDIHNPPADAMIMNSGNNPYFRTTRLDWYGTRRSTVGVGGAAAPPPSNPTEWIEIEVAGFKRQIPVYEVP